MTALAQFAFISPIHRVKHWDATNRKRLKCWASESECVFCKRGLSKINEFTYGLYHSNSEYIGGGKTDVSYISATLATHTHFQKIFSRLIDEKVNPTDIVFELTRKKIKTSHGRVVNGYEINKTDIEMFV